MYTPAFRGGILLLLGAGSIHAVAADNPAAALEAPKVEVVGTTPLPALGLPKSKVPANIQVIRGSDMGAARGADVTDFLDGNAGSISLNSAQGNIFQPDVNFRGFTASHLLGLPQGLSVFQDGVRVNEAFGDTVNWDLIPQSAISSITVMPGSNPQFGLNTLGGSLAVNTKSGFQYPGFTASTWAGSYGRKAGSVEWGGFSDKIDYFVTGNYIKEDGWRDYSTSRLANFFGKVGYQDGVTDFDLSLTMGNNKMEGTQALPQSFLGNRAQAYTWPDRTANKLTMLNARLSHFVSEKLLLSGNAYVRQRRQDSFASNVNDNCENVPADCLLLPGDPSKEAQGSNDASTLRQNTFGATVQASYLAPLFGFDNQLSIGASADLGTTKFKQYEQETDFDGTRGTNILLDDLQPQTFIRGKNRYLGVYMTDTLSLSERTALTVSGRYNRANVKVEDQLGNKPAVNGDHTFSRLNPAVGLTYTPVQKYTTYASYSEGMRAPTPVELTCADPNAPCPLPNAFLADPPLRPVISRTYELGTRWGEGDFNWNMAVFRTDLQNDIQFISATNTSSTLGYFSNVGNTRRQGVELGGRVRMTPFTFSAYYTYLVATYQSSFILNSPNNSTAADLNSDGDANEIRVNPGNRVPNIPENSFKLRMDFAATPALSVGGNVVYNGSMYARGDENNQDSHGKTRAYTVLNMDAVYRFDSNWKLFARVNNVFNRKYENFAILGQNFFPGGTYTPGSAFSEPFYGVGAPRGIWIGVRYDMGRSGAAAKDD
ncbi:MAG: TonB-dependent receptor [Burkholderiales bacterium]